MLPEVFDTGSISRTDDGNALRKRYTSVAQDGTALPIPRRAYESVNRAIIQMR